MLEDGLGRFVGRRNDERDQVLDPEPFGDGPVVRRNGVGNAVNAAGVRVADERVARGDHVDGVGRDGRNRMGDGRDHADHSEGRELLEAEAMRSARRVRLEPLDSGNPMQHPELLDLVLEPADPGLLELERPPWDRVLRRHRFDACHDGFTVVERQPAELTLGFGRRGDRIIDPREETVLSR